MTVDGEAEMNGEFALEDLLKPQPLEERIYRFRCVEAWSMVIPWVGFPLSDLLERFNPTSKAKYVEFTTLYDPRQMPGQREACCSWPYVEGLRIDEAMHPLTLMVVGLYGQALPNQDGAPLRLDGAVEIRLQDHQVDRENQFHRPAAAHGLERRRPARIRLLRQCEPAGAIIRAGARRRERRIGAAFFAARRPTLPFNGYAEQVASLYQGMDLRRYF